MTRAHWITFHSLRRFFVTELFRRGGLVPAVQRLAGRAPLATTERYAHVVQDDLRAAIGLFGGRGNSARGAARNDPVGEAGGGTRKPFRARVRAAVQGR